MLNAIVKFAKSEDGAITVDWVVLTAAAAFLGAAVFVVIRPATEDVTNEIGSVLEAIEVPTTF